VAWPSGIRQRVTGVSANRALRLKEPSP